MSEVENIALVKRFIEAWNANDWADMEDLYARDAIVEAPEGWPEAEDPAGWPAIREQFERLKASWSDERVELVESRPAGDRVFVCFRWITTGDSSGVPVEAEMFAVYGFRDGAIVRASFFRDRGAALAAAGLEESE